MSEKDFLCKLDDLITNGVYGTIINNPEMFSRFLIACCLESRVFFEGLKLMNKDFFNNGYFTIVDDINNNSLINLITNSSKQFVNDFIIYNNAKECNVNGGFFYQFKKQCNIDRDIIEDFINKKTAYVKLVVPKTINYFFDSFTKKVKESFEKEDNAGLGDFGDFYNCKTINKGCLADFNDFYNCKTIISVDASYLITGLLTGSLCNGYFLENKDNKIVLSRLPWSIHEFANCYQKAIGGLLLSSGNFPDSWAYEAHKKQRVWKGAFTAW